jgi:hypothetical protein
VVLKCEISVYIMNLNPLKKLCGPSHFYLAISLFFILISFFQNMGSKNVYCLGSLTCDVTSTTLIFVMQLIYILFWTWILNLMCSSGATKIAWALVLLPFILMFLLIFTMMYR